MLKVILIAGGVVGVFIAYVSYIAFNVASQPISHAIVIDRQVHNGETYCMFQYNDTKQLDRSECYSQIGDNVTIQRDWPYGDWFIKN